MLPRAKACRAKVLCDLLRETHSLIDSILRTLPGVAHRGLEAIPGVWVALLPAPPRRWLDPIPFPAAIGRIGRQAVAIAVDRLVLLISVASVRAVGLVVRAVVGVVAPEVVLGLLA